jgi:hypothetical protein
LHSVEMMKGKNEMKIKSDERKESAKETERDK